MYWISHATAVFYIGVVGDWFSKYACDLLIAKGMYDILKSSGECCWRKQEVCILIIVCVIHVVIY
jgi:hypothetical protein